jgi:hypothetical protein
MLLNNHETTTGPGLGLFVSPLLINSQGSGPLRKEREGGREYVYNTDGFVVLWAYEAPHHERVRGNYLLGLTHYYTHQSTREAMPAH